MISMQLIITFARDAANAVPAQRPRRPWQGYKDAKEFWGVAPGAEGSMGRSSYLCGVYEYLDQLFDARWRLEDCVPLEEF